MAIDHAALAGYVGVLLIRQSYITGEEFVVSGQDASTIFETAPPGPWRYCLALYTGGQQRTGFSVTYRGYTAIYVQVFKR